MKTIDRSPRIRFSSLALSALLVSALSFADQNFATKVDTGVRAEMRDGVFLVGDVYRPEYDPAHPVPTIGGRLCCANAALPPGPFDQRPNESREDVLVYSLTFRKRHGGDGFIRSTLREHHGGRYRLHGDVDRRFYHDSEHPSALILPIVPR